MTLRIALRISILVAAVLGYVLHYALGVHPIGEDWKVPDGRFIADALNNVLWFGAPYILLAMGMAFGNARSLWAVLFCIVTIILFDVYMYLDPSQDRGVYLGTGLILLSLGAILGLMLANALADRVAQPGREQQYESEVRRNAYRLRVNVLVEDGAVYLEDRGTRELLCRPLVPKQFWYETWLALRVRVWDIQDFYHLP